MRHRNYNIFMANKKRVLDIEDMVRSIYEENIYTEDGGRVT